MDENGEKVPSKNEAGASNDSELSPVEIAAKKREREVIGIVISGIGVILTYILWPEITLTTIELLVVLTIVVVLHEMAHYLTARAFKIRVTDFFAGFGPVVISKTINGIRYGIRAIPAGGFVKIVGMTKKEDIGGVPEEETYRSAKAYKRFIIVAAGPVMNIFLGALCMLIAVSLIAPSNVSNYKKFTTDSKYTLTMTKDITVGLAKVPESMARVSKNVVTNSTDKIKQEDRGVSVVGMVQLTENVKKQHNNSLYFLYLGIFNIFIGVFNLLPIVPLDGGHILTIIFRKIAERFKKAEFLLNENAVNAVANIFVGVLISYSVILMFLDIVKPMF